MVKGINKRIKGAFFQNGTDGCGIRKVSNKDPENQKFKIKRDI